MEDYLARAKAYTNQLYAETQAQQRGGNAELEADQGVAMRVLIYHCTAAIVEAIRDAGAGGAR